jgi:non-homologous end joining protein Ku
MKMRTLIGRKIALAVVVLDARRRLFLLAAAGRGVVVVRFVFYVK